MMDFNRYCITNVFYNTRETFSVEIHNIITVMNGLILIEFQ